MRYREFPRLVSCILLCTMFLLLLPARALAVSQEEINELRKERLAIAEEHEEKQKKVDELEEEKASVVEKKQAMDERNELTRREIESIEHEISLYDQMIAEEAIKVEQAKAVEEEQASMNELLEEKQPQRAAYRHGRCRRYHEER